MKNNKILLAIMMAALAFTLVLGMAACNNGSTGGGTQPKTETYTVVSGGETYTLKITEARYTAKAGDTYTLTYGSKTSTGKVLSNEGGVLTLQPNKAEEGETFTVTVSGSSITAISGTITDDNGDKLPAPTITTPNTDPKSFKFIDFDGEIFAEAGITTFPCVITVVLIPEGIEDMAEALANYVAVGVWNNVPAEAVNYSYSTLTLWTADGKEWTGTGTYDVDFVISTAQLNEDPASFASIKAVYNTKSISFTTKETTVSWDKFEKLQLQ
jgi:hypothetical protein